MKRTSVTRAAVIGTLTALLAADVVLPAGAYADTALPAGCAQSGKTVTCTFGYTGAQTTFTVPNGISALTITATGASGGGNDTPGSKSQAGGLGGTATDTYTVGVDSSSGEPVYAGQTLYVTVGGAGSNPTYTPVGGFNGGGASSADFAGAGFSFGSGGGASDVRTSTAPLTTTDSRLVVGGGGGGQGSCSSNTNSYGGDAGQAGGVGSTPCGGIAGGGGSTAGGSATAPATPGTLGQGGNGAVGGAGGGGGGYYGGGGGRGDDEYISPGGGGGSSWTSLHGLSTTLASGGGNGSVVISYVLLTPQSVQFGTVPSTVEAGLSSTVTASGGGSTQPVVISRDASSTAGACTVTSTGGGTASVQYTHPGSCVIDANQAGDADYAAAQQVQKTVQVVGHGSSITLSTPASAVFGRAVTASAQVSVFDGTTPAGAVQFSVAGNAVGSAVGVNSSGSATSPDLSFVAGRQLDPGSYPLDATFIPSSSNYNGSAASTTAVTISKAGTTTSVTVAASSVTATVAPVAPGAGTPTGTVTFTVGGSTVGTAALSQGTATLAYAVPAGSQVSAAYAGDSDFTASSGSTARQDPSITATVTSDQPKTSYGWYHGPVTVTFTCTPGSAPLTAACPAPVTLTTDGANQTVTKTITAADGGTATAAVTGLNIDTAKPTLTGPVNGATYLGTAPDCAATDTLSGIATCTVKATQLSHSGTGLNPTSYRYTATATDKAGNTSSTTGVYTVLGIYLAGATYRNGVFSVKYGKTYPVTVTGYSSIPTFQYAVGYNGTPTKDGPALKSTGTKTWAITLPINTTFAGRHDWNIGIRTGDGVQHVIHIHQ